MLTTEAIKIDVIADNLIQEKKGIVAICAPLVEKKKGSFEKLLEGVAEKGFLKIYCDGEVTSLSPIPKLNKEQKHTIKVIIDYVRPQKTSQKRLIGSLEAALKISDGFIEVLESNSEGELDTQNKSNFSLKKGCPKCGFSWPKLDSRYFSANSVGRCSTCSGIGTLKSEEGGL